MKVFMKEVYVETCLVALFRVLMPSQGHAAKRFGHLMNPAFVLVPSLLDYTTSSRIWSALLNSLNVCIRCC